MSFQVLRQVGYTFRRTVVSSRGMYNLTVAMVLDVILDLFSCVVIEYIVDPWMQDDHLIISTLMDGVIFVEFYGCMWIFSVKGFGDRVHVNSMEYL